MLTLVALSLLILRSLNKDKTIHSLPFMYLLIYLFIHILSNHMCLEGPRKRNASAVALR